MSSNSLLNIISVVVLREGCLPDPKILSIPESAADAAAVNPNGIKILLVNGLITLFNNVNPPFSKKSANESS